MPTDSDPNQIATNFDADEGDKRGTKRKRNSRDFTREFDVDTLFDSRMMDATPDVKANGFRAFRLQRIIRENHLTSIRAIAFNFRGDARGTARNLLATASKGQVNVYDNQHIGKHLDIVSHLSLPNVDFTSVCWIQSAEYGPCVVAGTSKGKIHILSFVYSKEVAVISAPKDVILALEQIVGNEEWISLGKDGTVTWWRLGQLIPIQQWNFKLPATCMTVGKNFILVGHANGTVSSINLATDTIQPLSVKHGYPIANIKATETTIITASTDGTICASPTSADASTTTFHVEDACGSLDISPDELFICIGNKHGHVLIYKVNGTLVATLMHPRSNGPIGAVRFSHSMEHVVFTGQEGLLWRMDRITPSVVREWDAWKA